MKIESYLFFNGTCEEAMNFYAKTIGAKISFTLRYKETPPDAKKGQPPLPTGWDDKIMHANLVVGESSLMVSDVHESMCDGRPVNFNGFSLSITTKTVDETKRVFSALSQGGQVVMPVGPTFWGSPAFGMLVDKFGVSWMISTEANQ